MTTCFTIYSILNLVKLFILPRKIKIVAVESIKKKKDAFIKNFVKKSRK